MWATVKCRAMFLFYIIVGSVSMKWARGDSPSFTNVAKESS